MNGFEIFDLLAKVVTLAAHVVVAVICFKAHRRTGQQDLLVIALSASLAILATISNVFIIRLANSPLSFKLIWSLTTVAWTISILLYVAGISAVAKRYVRDEGSKSESE